MFIVYIYRHTYIHKICICKCICKCIYIYLYGNGKWNQASNDFFSDDGETLMPWAISIGEWYVIFMEKVSWWGCLKGGTPKLLSVASNFAKWQCGGTFHFQTHPDSGTVCFSVLFFFSLLSFLSKENMVRWSMEILVMIMKSDMIQYYWNQWIWKRWCIYIYTWSRGGGYIDIYRYIIAYCIHLHAKTHCIRKYTPMYPCTYIYIYTCM